MLLGFGKVGEDEEENEEERERARHLYRRTASTPTRLTQRQLRWAALYSHSVGCMYSLLFRLGITVKASKETLRHQDPTEPRASRRAQCFHSVAFMDLILCHLGIVVKLLKGVAQAPVENAFGCRAFEPDAAIHLSRRRYAAFLLNPQTNRVL